MSEIKTEMVERVAKAMQQRAKQPMFNIDSLEPVLVGSLGDAWLYLAGAAIREMREPTRDMELAVEDNDIYATWTAMIDAALTPTPE